MNKQSFTDIGNQINTAEFKGMVLTKLEYIEAGIHINQANIKKLEDENQCRKDWQESFDTRAKIYIGLATLIGGIIVWVGDKLFDFFAKR